MISVNWEKLLGEFADLSTSYSALPAYLAKKYLVAALRNAIKEAKGPQLLRKNTPPAGTRRGRRRAGEKRSTGDLRRAVTTKAKWIGRNRDGFAVAGLGYKYGHESRKAIWLEFGTTRIAGRKMVEKTFDSIRNQVAAGLSRSLASSLEAAVRELESGKNPGMSKRGRAAGL